MLESLKEAASEVSRERIRGAAWSAERLADALVEDEKAGRASCDYIDDIVRVVISTNPTMGSIASLAWAARESCYRGLRASDGASAFLEYMKWSRQKMVSRASELTKGGPVTIMSISYSSAVADILVAMGQGLRRAYVLESQPGGEGAHMAAELRKRGVEVILVPDAMASSYVGSADMIMIGADNVTSDGCIYNKVGTRNLAIIAGYFGKPVIAAFEPYKISIEARCGEVKLVERSYTADPWGEVRYYLFDELTRDLVDSIFSVNGLGDNTAPQLAALRRSFEEWVSSRLGGQPRRT